jgi:hypothetical protein
MKNTIIKHPLFVGNAITSVVAMATNTLVVDFVLSSGMNIYQMQLFAITLVGLVTSVIVAKNKALTKIAFKHFGTFLVIEAAINVALGLATLIVGSPMIYVISSILLVPFSRIQKYGTNTLVSSAFASAEERLEFDNATATYGSFINVAGIVIGFILNRTISGQLAFCILCLSEVINNVFYYKTYLDIKAKN